VFGGSFVHVGASGSQANGTVVHGTTAQIAITVGGILGEDTMLCYRFKLCANLCLTR
jgi:hypothetical protein